jgi:hypothetical protein
MMDHIGTNFKGVLMNEKNKTLDFMLRLAAYKIIVPLSFAVLLLIHASQT